jgi:CspA family cold shock protein
MQGTVKFFHKDARGYGFISGDNAEDVFVHITALSGTELQAGGLNEGQRVEYDVVGNTKG